MTPLIVFIHVPKTAGSTVNAIMKGHSPNGRGHIEELLDEDMEFKKAVNNLDWMSGHVSRDRIAIRIREVSRWPVRFFACVRNATEHLASHYNSLLSRGDQFDKGSQLNMIYSAMVGNGSTPDGVIQTLKEFTDLPPFQPLFLPAPGLHGIDTELLSAP